MTLSAEQFRNHLVWTSLSDLGPLIDQAMAHEGLDAQSLEELARLKSVLSFTGKRLAGADPYLFQPPIHDAISTALTTSVADIIAKPKDLSGFATDIMKTTADVIKSK